MRRKPDIAARLTDIIGPSMLNRDCERKCARQRRQFRTAEFGPDLTQHASRRNLRGALDTCGTTPYSGDFVYTSPRMQVSRGDVSHDLGSIEALRFAPESPQNSVCCHAL